MLTSFLASFSPMSLNASYYADDSQINISSYNLSSYLQILVSHCLLDIYTLDCLISLSPKLLCSKSNSILSPSLLAIFHIRVNANSTFIALEVSLSPFFLTPYIQIPRQILGFICKRYQGCHHLSPPLLRPPAWSKDHPLSSVVLTFLCSWFLPVCTLASCNL